jgi:PsbP
MRAAAAVLLTLAACATARPTWVPATTPFTAATTGFEVSVPQDWMQLNAKDRDVLVITRDGTPLQRIVVRATDFGKPIGIGESKRVVTAGMSPQELAEAVVDDLSTGNATDVRILENTPATLGGHRGFRVVAAARAANGRAIRAAVYGLASERRFYVLMFVAPERHYFALDLPTFEALVRSFRLSPPPPSA